MTAGPDPTPRRRATARRARAKARRQTRSARGDHGRRVPSVAESWTVPSLAGRSAVEDTGDGERRGGGGAGGSSVAAAVAGAHAGPEAPPLEPQDTVGVVDPAGADAVAPPAPVVVPSPPDGPRPEPERPPPSGPPGRGGRGRRARSVVRLRRARRRVAAAMTVLVATGGGLVAVGWNQVRGSTAGDYVDPSLQPDDPGYAAFVTPTPTMLVLLPTAEGELAGTALLALQPGDDGGSVIVIPAATQVAQEGTLVPLLSAYAEGGAAAVRELVEQATGFAIRETMEIGSQRWTTLVGPVGPLSIEIDTPVEEWEAGVVSVEPVDMGRFLVGRDADQSRFSQALRQEAFWRAWLERVAAEGDDAIAGELDSGLGRFVRGLARAPEVDGLAVTVAIGETGEEFDIDETLASEQFARSVPFPQSPSPGVRPRVRLLNGTDDRSLTTQAAELLVRDGAEIVISGNAMSFEEPTTRIFYADETLRSAATGYRDALGIGVVEIDPSGQDASALDESERIDITIILGADAPEAIEEVGQAG